MNKITENYLVVSPAYDRDYSSIAKVTKAFLSGKNFKCESIINLGNLGSGTYCSIRDFASGVKVNVRYSNMRKGCVVTVP